MRKSGSGDTFPEILFYLREQVYIRCHSQDNSTFSDHVYSILHQPSPMAFQSQESSGQVLYALFGSTDSNRCSILEDDIFHSRSIFRIADDLQEKCRTVLFHINRHIKNVKCSGIEKKFHCMCESLSATVINICLKCKNCILCIEADRFYEHCTQDARCGIVAFFRLRIPFLLFYILQVKFSLL